MSINQMYIKPKEGGWHHFYFPQSTFADQMTRLKIWHPYEMIILRRQGELYFFANCVAWCLGHAEPHQAIQNYVVRDKIHTLENVGGLFLKEDAVRELAANSNQAFIQWLDAYVQPVP